MGSIGYVASSWSRVIVPNVVGLTALNASTQIISAGLTVGTVTTTTTGATSGNNGTVASQSLSAGSDVERSTSVSYVTYNYVTTTPPPDTTAPPGVLGIWYAYCTPNFGPSGPTFAANTNCVDRYNLLMNLGEIGSSWSCAAGYDNDPNKAGITAPNCDIGGTTTTTTTTTSTTSTSTAAPTTTTTASPCGDYPPDQEPGNCYCSEGVWVCG